MPERNGAHTDVVVIGGGVIGLAVAWRAARAGLGVTVLERGRPGGETSHVAAGMLAPISEASAADRALLELGLRAAAGYADFVAELAETSGRDPGYLPCGTLALARDADEAGALERELDLRRGLGLEVVRLRASAARELEPALAPTLRLALEVPTDHAIDPRRLTGALTTAVQRAGGTVRTGAEVAEIAVRGGRAAGAVLVDGERLPAGEVVVAAGPWSGLIEGLPPGARVPLRAVKGQILRLRDPAGPGLVARSLRIGAGAYVVPRGDGRYVLGATMEERGFDRTVTAGAVFDLLRDAIELVPAFAELVLEETAAGLRPATPDGLPAVGAGALPGLHWATGHHRSGVLLAPLSAELVVAGLAGAPPEPELDPARFAVAAAARFEVPAR